MGVIPLCKSVPPGVAGSEESQQNAHCAVVKHVVHGCQSVSSRARTFERSCLGLALAACNTLPQRDDSHADLLYDATFYFGR